MSILYITFLRKTSQELFQYKSRHSYRCDIGRFCFLCSLCNEGLWLCVLFILFNSGPSPAWFSCDVCLHHRPGWRANNFSINGSETKKSIIVQYRTEIRLRFDTMKSMQIEYLPQDIEGYNKKNIRDKNKRISQISLY